MSDACLPIGRVRTWYDIVNKMMMMKNKIENIAIGFLGIFPEPRMC